LYIQPSILDGRPLITARCFYFLQQDTYRSGDARCYWPPKDTEEGAREATLPCKALLFHTDVIFRSEAWKCQMWLQFSSFPSWRHHCDPFLHRLLMVNAGFGGEGGTHSTRNTSGCKSYVRLLLIWPIHTFKSAVNDFWVLAL
jgi:hypothetical protein